MKKYIELFDIVIILVFTVFVMGLSSISYGLTKGVVLKSLLFISWFVVCHFLIKVSFVKKRKDG